MRASIQSCIPSHPSALLLESKLQKLRPLSGADDAKSIWTKDAVEVWDLEPFEAFRETPDGKEETCDTAGKSESKDTEQPKGLLHFKDQPVAECKEWKEIDSAACLVNQLSLKYWMGRLHILTVCDPVRLCPIREISDACLGSPETRRCEDGKKTSSERYPEDQSKSPSPSRDRSDCLSPSRIWTIPTDGCGHLVLCPVCFCVFQGKDILIGSWKPEN